MELILSTGGKPIFFIYIQQHTYLDSLFAIQPLKICHLVFYSFSRLGCPSSQLGFIRTQCLINNLWFETENLDFFKNMCLFLTADNLFKQPTQIENYFFWIIGYQKWNSCYVQRLNPAYFSQPVHLHSSKISFQHYNLLALLMSMLYVNFDQFQQIKFAFYF